MCVDAGMAGGRFLDPPMVHTTLSAKVRSSDATIPKSQDPQPKYLITYLIKQNQCLRLSMLSMRGT